MASTKTKKAPATKKASTSKKAPTTKAEKDTEDNVTLSHKEDTGASKPIVPKDVDINDYIMVKNGFQGKLVYVSKRTGETFIWDNFGDMQEIELRELRNAKSSAKAFFINNWFMFNDEDMWVVDFLGVSQYYKKALPLEKFDEIFDMPADEAKEVIANMTDGQRSSFGYRARQKVVNGEVDSRKMISMLEEALGIELIEK